MHHKGSVNQTILITGGTSGLGLGLAKHFLRDGFNVVATGRQLVKLSGFKGKYFLYRVDFNDLSTVAASARKICSDHSISLIVNNAGILSPPSFTVTKNGLESTFQINFLAHLIIDEIILNSISDMREIRIASVTSPVYRMASARKGPLSGPDNYSPVRSYSSSKLYLAMMCEFLHTRHREASLLCFSFNPGTFSSGIYRMQKKWFWIMYRIAAPFMRSPVSVAKVLAELLLNKGVENGMIYDILNRRKSPPELNGSEKEALIRSCYEIIDGFIK